MIDIDADVTNLCASRRRHKREKSAKQTKIKFEYLKKCDKSKLAALDIDSSSDMPNTHSHRY